MDVTKINALKGELTIPGDKSISHRAIMLGSLATGTTRINNFLEGADCLSTIQCFRKMGVDIARDESSITIKGKGLHSLKDPLEILNVGNSGTTIRLLSGLLAPQPFTTTITGDESIQKRPMKRVIEPLTMMGGNIKSAHGSNCAPLEIKGTPLKGIHYISHVASAQVKSAILLAGLYADGETMVTEPFKSRDHTERMLNYFGATVSSTSTTASIQPCDSLQGQEIHVPGDISSAAFFIVAALIVPHSEVLLKHVGINKTRDGILRVCKNMGADITILNEQSNGGEPTADLLIKSSKLHGTTIEGADIPTLIDELPIIAILATQAEGTTIIKDAEELKVKESNRIDLVVDALKSMGGVAKATEDGMIIEGGSPLKGTRIPTKKDHRIAMSFTVAGLVAEGTTTILDSDCIDVSYPNFYHHLKLLSQKN